MKNAVLILILILILLMALAAHAKRDRKKQSRGAETLVEYKISHEGRNRTSLIYLPPGYTEKEPLPLVLVFHGGGGNAKSIAKKTQMHKLAAIHNFIVAYPNGTGRAWRKRLSWNAGSVPAVGYAEKNGVDDVGFIRKLLNNLSQEYKIDPKRIYSTGFSKGGMLVYRLACELSNRIAAIAPVAASMTFSECRPAEPVSVLAIHGTKDENVPREGGKGRYSAKKAQYPSLEASIKKWLVFDRCKPKSLSDKMPSSVDTDCFVSQECANDTNVGYCLIREGGHAWPGAAPSRKQKKAKNYVSPHFFASEKIWQFFKNHPKH